MPSLTVSRGAALWSFLAAGIACWPAAAAAGDFDKNKNMLCALGEAFECTKGQSCERVLPAEIGAPHFFRIDVANRVAQGVGPGAPGRKSPIASLSEVGGMLVLQGVDEEREGERGAIGWNASVSPNDGGMVLTAAAAEDGTAFVVFGDCLNDQ